MLRVQVSMSMLEIVEDKPRDLLQAASAAQPASIKVSNDRLGKVALEGLSEHAVDSAAGAVQILQHGRQAAASARGHRGHLLVSIWLRCKEKRVGGRSTAGRLTLADLSASDGVRAAFLFVVMALLCCCVMMVAYRGARPVTK